VKESKMSYPKTTESVRAAQRAEALAAVVLERVARLTAEAAQRNADTSGLDDLARLAELLAEATTASVQQAERVPA
jgi:hypothetical protein